MAGNANLGDQSQMATVMEPLPQMIAMTATVRRPRWQQMQIATEHSQQRRLGMIQTPSQPFWPTMRIVMESKPQWTATIQILAWVYPTEAVLNVQITCATLADTPFLNNGTYYIDPAQNGNTMQVYCDMQNGGWTYQSQGNFYPVSYTGGMQSMTSTDQYRV